MNTSEDGAQMAPGASTNGASSVTNPTTKPPARRRRAPNRRTKAENATAPVETQPETPPETRAETQTEAPAEAQSAANGAAETAGEQAERKTTRPRRARATKSRRPAVELVRPSAAEQAEETVGASTETPVEGAADGADDGAQPAVSAPVEAEGAPTRRYRFQRPARVATQTGAAPAVRPERLSGRMAQPAPVEAESAPETQAETTAAVTAEPEESLESLLAGLGAVDTASAGEPIVIEEGAPEEPPLLEPDVEPLAEDGVETAEVDEARDEHEEGTSTTRRRRRRRRTSPHASEAEESAEQPTTRTGGLSVVDFGAPTAVERRQSGLQTQTTETPYTPLSAPYTPGGMQGVRDRGARRTSTQPPAWNSGDASQEIGEPDSPYVSPEPAYPRGFGPQPRGVAGPVREPYAPRTGQRSAETPISTNQVAGIVSSAIQQQTDRLLTELRRQAPPANMTISMPPFPSTERVGVFVDVANIVYSSRNLRTHVDFGRLLDFLRGNRRLIRAHAYAPTSPEPQANQEFLSPVKGVGYRITTKNYKTFSSGAKKADLDLDLCMDIVRLVDSGAVETVVLVSGDSDFLPLLEYCSDKGVRVEVAAFDDSAAAILRQSCDLFINLSLVDDILV
jgi:uncharacterized LabA/DUF88 family protein